MACELPRTIVSLLRFLWVSEAVLGDLAEEWAQGNLDMGWMWREALSAVLHRSRKRNRGWIRQPQERSAPMFRSFWSDVRYAARGLLHNPGFAAVAVLAIAL